MTSALFIYNAPVVDSIHPRTDGPDESQWLPALSRLTQLLDEDDDVDGRPRTRTLLPYTTFLLDHESCYCPPDPDSVREFQYDMAFLLSPETTIQHRRTTYRPTAWILRLGRLVPFEFLREDACTTTAGERAQQHRRLFRRVVPVLMEFATGEHLILRLRDGIWKAGQYGEGAFRAIDSHVALRYLPGGRQPFTWEEYKRYLQEAHLALR